MMAPQRMAMAPLIWGSPWAARPSMSLIYCCSARGQTEGVGLKTDAVDKKIVAKSISGMQLQYFSNLTQEILTCYSRKSIGQNQWLYFIQLLWFQVPGLDFFTFCE